MYLYLIHDFTFNMTSHNDGSFEHNMLESDHSFWVLDRSSRSCIGIRYHIKTWYLNFKKVNLIKMNNISLLYLIIGHFILVYGPILITKHAWDKPLFGLHKNKILKKNIFWNSNFFGIVWFKIRKKFWIYV